MGYNPHSMVKIHKQEQTGNVVTIEAEADVAALNVGMEQAFKDLAKTAKVPGFRPGKIPRGIFEKYYGKELILDRAAGFVVEAAYPKLIELSKIEPIEQPSKVDVQTIAENQPVVFTITVEVKPEVKLGKYKGIKIEAELKKGADEQVQHQLEHIADQFSEYKVVSESRGLQNDDLATYFVTAMVDGQPYQPWCREPGGGRVGTPWIDQKFDEQILGQKIGEERNFVISFATDHAVEEVRGKDVSFFVKLSAVHEQTRPAIDDELAKKSGRFQTLDELKADVRQHLDEQARQAFEREQREKLFDAIIDRCTVDAPSGMVKREVERSKKNLQQELSRQKLDLETYARLMKKEMSDIEAELRGPAEKRVKVGLILEAIGKAEEIKITDQDYDAEISRQAVVSKLTEDEVRKAFNEHYKSYMEPYLLEEKTIMWLLDQAKIG